MAFFRCKMCGGDLNIQTGESSCTCEFCGTTQTIPTVHDENLQALFNRANVLRMKSEFDKAEAVYEKILQANETEAEAYWGLILCKYGIEYVEDPKTFKRIPTCHRTSFDPIASDEDYKNALKYADVVRKQLYEAEAKTIDEIQKGILLISQKEDSYDVFICYKETDQNGKRTVDSTIANDIYYQLTNEGFRVFYAAITLEDKLGSEYEPYIFSALNTAKVMLCLGTKPEYFGAVWVKNEWSRFLKTMKVDRGKMLIPCYRDMDPYELPEEFSHLQAQDMSKIGFITDLVRGIKKVIEKPVATPSADTVVMNPSAAGNTAPLLKRAFMFLEDGDWSKADEFCEQVLNLDPENAQAYLGKLMAELKVHSTQNLKNCAQPFDHLNHYKKTLRFADLSLRQELQGYVTYIKERNETSRKNGIYDSAKSSLNTAQNESAFKAAEKLFRSIPGWKDADALAVKAAEEAVKAAERAECDRKDAIYHQAKQLATHRSISDLETAITQYNLIPGWKDSDIQIEQCMRRIEEIKEEDECNRKDSIYAQAGQLAERKRVADIEQAIEKYRSIPGWRDSDTQITVCLEKIEEIHTEEDRARLRQVAKEKARKKKMALIAATVVSVGLCAILLVKLVIPTLNYNKADKLIASGEYTEAMDILLELEFKDSAQRYDEAFIALKKSFAAQAEASLAAGDTVQAALYYRKAGDIQRANEIFNIDALVDAGEFISAGIMADGTLKYQSNREGGDKDQVQNRLEGVTAFLSDDNGLIGVDSTGKLLNHSSSELGLESYLGVKQVIEGYHYDFKSDYAVLLLEDGTVKYLYEGSRSPYPQIDGKLQKKNWERLASIYEGNNCIIGIDEAGNVYLAREEQGNSHAYPVSKLSNVKKVVEMSADKHLFALTKDGILISLSLLEPEQIRENVVDICKTEYGVLVLYENGKVEMIRRSENFDAKWGSYMDIVCGNLNGWNGIVSIQEGARGLIGIRYDGTVKYVSVDFYYDSDQREPYQYASQTELGQELSTWTDITAISAAWKRVVDFSGDDGAWGYVIGITSDGTAVSTGNGTYYTYEKKDYSTGYYYKAHNDGTYHDVTSWKFW